MGEVKHSLFTVLKQHLEKTNDSLLVINGEHDIHFTEVMMPYIEHHSFQDYEATKSKE